MCQKLGRYYMCTFSIGELSFYDGSDLVRDTMS